MLADLKSVEFSYEELAEATNDFNLSYKIGQGGFASVYYGVIRNQVSYISFLIRRDST
jgi:chitin elicitor receptor kinase 1